jgi:hypothetical protein
MIATATISKACIPFFDFAISNPLFLWYLNFMIKFIKTGLNQGHMQKRGISKLYLVLIVVILLALAITLFIFLSKPRIEPYSDDPKTWVSDVEGGIKVVDVDRVTFGKGYADSSGQQIRIGDVLTVFAYDGWYKDSYFKLSFVDNNRTVIAINSFMMPGDGVIEGYIVSAVEDDSVVSDIFVDEDWKSVIGSKTNIIWGKDYQNIKSFSFTEVSDGVYKDSVVDDLSRFSEDFRERVGGIIVGDISMDNVNNENFDGVVFIRQY